MAEKIYPISSDYHAKEGQLNGLATNSSWSLDLIVGKLDPARASGLNEEVHGRGHRFFCAPSALQFAEQLRPEAWRVIALDKLEFLPSPIASKKA
jgi:hypothetical protein